MPKNERHSLIRSIATRAARVLDRCAAAGLSLNQARRTLRRTCPRLNLARA